MKLQTLLKVARGEREADLLLKNCEVINVFTHSIERGSVAIAGDTIIGFGEYPAKKEVDLQGRYLAPGLIDGHIHIESSMIPPKEFARAVLPFGTTAVITDPHEIANVMGVEGIKFMLESGKDSGLDIFVMLPSCVPATDMETSGARLTAKELKPLLSNKGVLGLGELMNYPGVIFGDPEVVRKITIASGGLIDGHAPGLTGKELNAYICAGITSDHETTTLEEAREKLARGMYVMIRLGSTAKNMDKLLPLVNQWTARFCMLVTDDLPPNELIARGHLNYLLQRAVQKGVDPVTAVSMVTLTPATYFALKGKGAIAPGYKADLVVFEDLAGFKVEQVYKDGKLVVEEGKHLGLNQLELASQAPLKVKLSEGDLCIKASGGIAKVIGVIPDQIVTEKLILPVKINHKGEVLSDTGRDILKIAVFERHEGTGNVGLGLIKGFGLKKGALASSVAHDSHNIMAVGVNDDDILIAAKKVAEMGGGQVVVCDGEVRAALPLPIAGLMSNLTVEEVATGVEELQKAAAALGCPLPAAFMTLSFMALPVIPELKITDKGLVDVTAFRHVDLFGKE